MELLLLVLVGAIAGMLAGLFGIGGGAIIVPVLVFVFEHEGAAGGALMQSAIGTSLATIAVTAVSSIRAHHARRAIQWPIFWRLTPGILIGALLGASIAHQLPSRTLKIMFGIFLLVLAARMALPAVATAARPLPRSLWMWFAGILVGTASSLFGIGGAALSVPFLVRCGLSPVQAVATAAALSLPLALAGTAGYIVTGLQATNLPPYSFGYVVLPAFAGIVVASVLFAPLGARLAHRLRPLALRRTFAAVLVVLGLNMLLR